MSLVVTFQKVTTCSPADGEPGQDVLFGGVGESYPGQTTFFGGLLGFIGFHWGGLESTDPVAGLLDHCQAQGGAAADERRRHPPLPRPGPSERHTRFIVRYCLSSGPGEFHWWLFRFIGLYLDPLPFPCWRWSNRWVATSTT